MDHYLAIDIGASSGRHIVGYKENGELHTEEVYRFPNCIKKQNGHLVWNIGKLFDNVVKGIGVAFGKYPDIRSVSIDTWGCDYVLLSGSDIFGPCLSYRDGRTKGVTGKVHEIIPFEELYLRTGIQFQPFNTIYQLYEDKLRGRLSVADDFLMIPEYLNYRLTGVKMHEYTNATTTGLVNAGTGEYDRHIIGRLGFDERLFPELHKPGEKVGRIMSSVSENAAGAEVVLCATHDTASAVEGIPMEGEELYISSGTWSLLGVKIEKTLTDENSRKANFSNEGGVGYIRYQKNIMGMWIVNSLKEELCPDKSFEEITEAARESGYDEIADINAPMFLSPEKMTEAFRASVTKGFGSVGDYFRCAFGSLAQSYRRCIAELEANTGRKYKKLYIVGGGAKNVFLNELTAEATGKDVIALPVEATAAGNLKIQIERGERSERSI